MNHVTPEGLLAGIKCDRPIRYRDPAVILQDACTAEPRIDLILNPMPDDPAGQEYAHVQLDVTTATHIMRALHEFLAAHVGVPSWRHDGVYYSLEHAWQGRPKTGVEGLWFRWTHESQGSVPVMAAIDDDTITALLPQVLGLKQCPVHNIWDAPCHKCALEGHGMLPVNRAHP
jgi:hypothetical protein